MKIFVSWSGDRSKLIASALKDWLPNILQGTDVFVSNHDILPGTRWSHILNGNLEDSNFGIVCLTPENLNAPWILFEAGALSKSIDDSLLIPYLLDLRPVDVSGPLAQFQNITCSEPDTFRMIESINNIRTPMLSIEQLRFAFDKWWPELKVQIEKALSIKTTTVVQTTQFELLEEIVQFIRKQSQNENRISQLRGMTEEELWKMKNTDISAFIQNAVKRMKEGIAQSEMTQMKEHLVLAATILKEKNPGYTEVADNLIKTLPGIKIPILKHRPS